MMRKTLTPIALGFAVLTTLGACGGGDDAAMDTGMAADTASTLPAPAPAPMPMPTDTMTDTTQRDTTQRDTTRPPGN